LIRLERDFNHRAAARKSQGAHVTSKSGSPLLA
jgi:hypothetical protein